MKRIHIAGNLLKSLMLAGIMTACNNDQEVIPTNVSGVTVDDQNAKISALTRLVDDNGRSIQYLKSGKFFGKISKVNKGPWDNYYVTYTYNDSNPSGDLWISKKTYQSSNNSFIKEHKFKVVNGLCVLSENDAGDAFEYKYNPQGYLDEVKKIKQGLSTESWKYKYDWTYRLTTIEHTQGGNPYHSYHFSYDQIQDKYPLNLEPDGINIGGINDKYLPLFGKHSSPAIYKITDYNFLTNKNTITHYSQYATDSDGLITSREMIKYSAASVETFKYSDNWQGI